MAAPSMVFAAVAAAGCSRKRPFRVNRTRPVSSPLLVFAPISCAFMVLCVVQVVGINTMQWPAAVQPEVRVVPLKTDKSFAWSCLGLPCDGERRSGANAATYVPCRFACGISQCSEDAIGAERIARFRSASVLPPQRWLLCPPYHCSDVRGLHLPWATVCVLVAPSERTSVHSGLWSGHTQSG